VFVEKPMALTAQEANVMVAAADRGRLLTVGHNHLFDPIVKEARSRVTQGRLGQLIGLDVFHGALPGGSAWLSELPSGPWMEDVPHVLYLSQLFMGDILTIQAIGQQKSAESKVTELRLVARHAGGASSMTYSSGAVPFRIRLTLFGTERTMEVDLITGTLIESREFEGHRWLTKGMAAASVASQLLLGAGRNALGVLTGRVRSWPGLHALIEAFYEAIRTGGPSPVPATQGARATELMEEIGRHLDGVSRGSNG
jgi:predicted dehydrogenase